MITNISLTGFKSFADSELTPGSLTVLTGYSGAGKTNLLDALTLVSRALSDGFEAATASSPRLAPATLLLQSEDAGRHRTAQTMLITVEAVISGPAGPLPVAVDLAAVRSADGRTALFDASGSGVRTFDSTGAQQRHPLDGGGALLEAVREEASGWSAIPGGPSETAEALRRLGPVEAAWLDGDLAALVHDCSGVRAADAGEIEVRMAFRGWVPAAMLPASALRIVDVLVAWHSRPGGVLVLDGLGKGLHPQVSGELARRIARRLDSAGPADPAQLITSTHALDLVNCLAQGAHATVVVIDKAHRADPTERTITLVSVARPVREPLHEEESGSCVRPSRLARMLTTA